MDEINEKLAELKDFCDAWNENPMEFTAEQSYSLFSDVVLLIAKEAGLTYSDTTEFYEAVGVHALSMLKKETQSDVKAVLELIHDKASTQLDVDMDDLWGCFFYREDENAQ